MIMRAFTRILYRCMCVCMLCYSRMAVCGIPRLAVHQIQKRRLLRQNSRPAAKLVRRYEFRTKK